jgi:arylformamidase
MVIDRAKMQTYMPPGTAPKSKGPLVFLDYDKEEIDASYDQAPWVTNQAEVAKRNAQKNSAALARLGPPRRLAYGSTPIEKLDLYTTKQPNAPINVFIHGGAWRVGSAADAAYMSEMFIDAGAHFIALDFNNVIETHGNLLAMAQQVRRAVAWVYANAGSFGADSNRLYVSGISSGAHLAAVVLTTDWQKEFGLPIDTVKGGLCCSGMYDLYPVSARGNRCAELAASPRYASGPRDRRPRHAGDARVPAAESRVRHGRENGRKARDVPRRRGLQPLRDI